MTVMMELYVSHTCPNCNRLIKVLDSYTFFFSDVPKTVRFDANPTRFYEVVDVKNKGAIPVRIEGTGLYHRKEMEEALSKLNKTLADTYGGGVPQIVLKKRTSKGGVIKIVILGAPKEGGEREFVLRLRSLIELLKKL